MDVLTLSLWPSSLLTTGFDSRVSMYLAGTKKKTMTRMARTTDCRVHGKEGSVQ